MYYFMSSSSVGCGDIWCGLTDTWGIVETDARVSSEKKFIFLALGISMMIVDGVEHLF